MSALPSEPGRPVRTTHRSQQASGHQASVIGGLPYLLVLAGAAVGLAVAWQGSRYAGRGAAVVGGALLAGALVRLVLPPRYAGLLASRRKALDVLAFAVLGSGVLAVALVLP